MFYLLKWHFRVFGSAKKFPRKAMSFQTSFGSGMGNLKSGNLKPAPPCACFHRFFSRVLGFPVTMLHTLITILSKARVYHSTADVYFTFLVEIVTRLQKEFHKIVYQFVFWTSLHRASLLRDAVAKGQMKSECIYEIMDFPKYQQKKFDRFLP